MQSSPIQSSVVQSNAVPYSTVLLRVCDSRVMARERKIERKNCVNNISTRPLESAVLDLAHAQSWDRNLNNCHVSVHIYIATSCSFSLQVSLVLVNSWRYRSGRWSEPIVGLTDISKNSHVGAYCGMKADRLWHREEEDSSAKVEKQKYENSLYFFDTF